MKQQVSPGIIIAAIVVVLGLGGVVAYMTLGKHKDAPAMDTSNPMYQKYIQGAGSAGEPGSPNSGGSTAH